MSFGEIVIGAPGSGKTTLCFRMRNILSQQNRKVGLINLDPANNGGDYDVDISELVKLEEIMKEYELGPNGGLLFCIEFLEKNFEWMENAIKEMKRTRHMIILDCPGQVELYSLNSSMKNILKKIESLGVNLCVVNLVDIVHCTNPSNYISAVLLSLSFMIQLEFPHVNVLSKADLLPKYGEFAFDVDFYQNATDISMLSTYCIEGTPNFTDKFKDMTKSIVEVIEDFSLVSFQILSVMDDEKLMNLARVVDRAVGNIYSF